MAGVTLNAANFNLIGSGALTLLGLGALLARRRCESL